MYHSLYEKPAMYALLPNLKGKSVLSLGCGSGEDSRYLKQQGAAKSVGIDISPNMIAIATKSHPDCQFEVMNMERLNFDDASLDFAYSSLAIHYLKDWAPVFKEVFRVIKPGSSFLFSCGHPVTTALAITENSDETRIRQLARITNKRTNTVTIIGDYLSQRPVEELGAFDVTTWHKPIGQIVSEITASGFLVQDFIEPVPLPTMKNISSKDYDKLIKIPEFMIFKLLKPSQ